MSVITYRAVYRVGRCSNLFHYSSLLISSLLSLSLFSAELTAQIVEHQGQTASGAYYTIAIPQAWQPAQGLVIWNHGYQGYTTSEPEPNPSLGPLEDFVLEQGYALAASSFSQTGWAVFSSHIDNQQLYEKFVELAAQPQRVFIQGASMGGIVSVRDLEAGLIPDVEGALLLCGAVAGSENWVEAFDLRMVYEAVCSNVSGAELPTQSWTEQPGFISGELAFLDSLERCTGLASSNLLDSPFDVLLQDPEKTERLNRILALTNTDVDFLLTNLGYAVFEIPNLVNDAKKLNGLKPFGNAGIDYGDAEINLTIQRSVALPSARDLFFDNYTPSGNIGSAKVVSIHTSKDGLVRVENQQSLIGLLPADQLTIAIVVEDESSHCGFSDGEGLSAWNSLIARSDGGVQPDVQSIQANCQQINADPGQCRYDPAFEIGDTLLSFPREQSVAPLGSNSFDAATGLLNIDFVRVPEDSVSYNLQLLEPQSGSSLFTVYSSALNLPVSSWQHGSLYYPAEGLLYLPDLYLEPFQTGDSLYNVYMRLREEGGQQGLELEEYELAN